MKLTRKVLIFLVGSSVLFVLGYVAGRNGTLRKDGFLAAHTRARSSPFRTIGGFWHVRRGLENDRSDKARDAFRSLPYVTGSHPSPEKLGVIRHDPAQASGGLTLYSSAHGPEAFLISMDGRVLHRWRKERDEVWPHLAGKDLIKPRRFFRRVRLFDNGDLLAIYPYTGIIRLDADSNVIWAHLGRNHHDLDIDDRGNIYVLGLGIAEAKPQSPGNAKISPRTKNIGGKNLLNESITVLSAQGKVLASFSILECILRSPFYHLLDAVGRIQKSGLIDFLHANTLQVFDGSQAHSSPLFQKGNILTSFRQLSTIAIIDPKARTVLWTLSNAWRRQHQPELLAPGTMLVFDNYGGTLDSGGRRKYSRVIEFDPLTQEVLWEYRGSRRSPFFSALMGSNQRLENGNTLITESDFGRVLEVTPNQEIVWEFVNPHTSGSNNEFIAIIPEAIRLRADFPAANFIRENP